MFLHLNRKSMFAGIHSMFYSPKSSLLHLTGQPYCKKGRLAKVKDGIINLILGNYLIGQYKYIIHTLMCMKTFSSKHIIKCFKNAVMSGQIYTFMWWQFYIDYRWILLWNILYIKPLLKALALQFLDTLSDIQIKAFMLQFN